LVVATSSDAAGENAMADPVSISVKQVSAVARASVKKAIEGSAAPFLIPNYTVGFIPPYWWLGIVIRNPDSQITLAAAQKLATGVQSDVANSVAELRNGTAGIIFVDGHVTIGFAPPPETVIQE